MAGPEADDDLAHLARTSMAGDYFHTAVHVHQAGPIIRRDPVLRTVPYRQSVSAVSTVGFADEVAVLESSHRRYVRGLWGETLSHSLTLIPCVQLSGLLPAFKWKPPIARKPYDR